MHRGSSPRCKCCWFLLCYKGCIILKSIRHGKSLRAHINESSKTFAVKIIYIKAFQIPRPRRISVQHGAHVHFYSPSQQHIVMERNNLVFRLVVQRVLTNASHADNTNSVSFTAAEIFFLSIFLRKFHYSSKLLTSFELPRRSISAPVRLSNFNVLQDLLKDFYEQLTRLVTKFGKYLNFIRAEIYRDSKRKPDLHNSITTRDFNTRLSYCWGFLWPLYCSLVIKEPAGKHHTSLSWWTRNNFHLHFLINIELLVLQIFDVSYYRF